VQSADALILRTQFRTQSVDALLQDVSPRNVPATHAPGPTLRSPSQGPPVLARQTHGTIGFLTSTLSQSVDAVIRHPNWDQSPATGWSSSGASDGWSGGAGPGWPNSGGKD
jgi:hypothetical protein